MGGEAESALGWLGLPVIVTVAWLLSSSATKSRTVTPSRGGSRSGG
jgi:hypothetical protein